MSLLITRYLIPIILLTAFQSCFFGDQSVIQKADTPAIKEYKAGLNSLNKSDLIHAEIHFQNALASRDNFAPALEGMARIFLERNQPLLAERYLEQAVQADQNWVPAYILKSRLYLANEDFDLAREELRLAQKRIKKHQLKNFETEIQPLLAQACFGMGNYQTAARHYKSALNKNPKDKQLSRRYEQAKNYAKLLKNKNERLKKVVRSAEIGRGDLALLMRHFLKFDSNIQQLGKLSILDLPQDELLAESILKCCSASYLPVLPDGTFHPEDKVDRAEMALFIERILSHRYPFFVRWDSINVKDVERYQPFTKAVQLSLTLKLMEQDNNQNFRPYAILSGTEALVIVYRLATFLELPVFPMHFLRNQRGDTKNN